MTISVTSPAATPLPRRPLARLAAGTLRQHRFLLICLAVAYAAVAARLLATGLPLHAVYGQYVRHHCVTAPHSVCGPLLSRMDGSWVLSFLGVGLIPAVAGVFAGAPLGSRGFETGSYRFSSVQGVSARRQLATTLLVIGALVTIGAAVTGGLTVWCLAPFQRISLVPDTGISWWWPAYFNATAPMLAAWALLDFSLGVLAGTLIRRTVPAMAVTLACGVVLAVAGCGYGLSALGLSPMYGSAQPITADLLTIAPRALPAVPQIFPEAHYNAARHTGYPARPGERGPVTEVVFYPHALPGPDGSLEVGGWFTRAGRRLTADAAQAMLNTIPRAVTAQQGRVRTWLAARKIRYWIGYQPASRFWIFQAIEAALLAAIAALAGASAVWRAGRRS